ncbi:tannase/feruloyl esterase family alpha/beta hydrolase [Aquincola sp. MAHUQ-54]|uniref:Tannase/feruloyl esterase family alpha/beta hydrolase n=1 Tax=Aquincola agrisoli TaxID=3119538 RepID=A0AAW9PYI7_9BURK
MPTPSRHALATACAAAMLAACGGSDGDDAATAQQQCEALARTAVPATSLTAVYQADGAVTIQNYALPAHCLVEGKTNERTGVDGKAYAIGFRLRLPDQWNGRFLFMGGGGNDGSLGTTIGPNVGPIGGMKPALGEGYAIVSTDGGHTGGRGADFGSDPIARIDHAYNAFDKTAVNAKSLIAARYGRGPDHSYFSGCSGGGRQGMMFTQRFPAYFDGVIAHAPAMRVSSGATIAAMFNNLKLTQIAPVENGSPILSKALTDADLKLAAGKILERCDALDGVADGMVNHFQACNVDLAELQCTGAKTATCLSADQVGAMKALFDGPRNTAGTRLYAGQVMDPAIDQPGWRAWTLGSSTSATPNSAYNTLMADALRWEFFTPPDPDFAALDFDFDTDPLRMAATSSVYDTYADDKLTAYQARGGKLMFLHGMADPIFSAHDTVDYYQRLAANHGGIGAARAFSRLYAIPGENHCSGGRATDQFDALTAMVDWVEKGQAPDRLLAAASSTHPLFPNRTRPLCPYPQYAKYNGTGNVEDAASFTCTAP